MKNIFVFLFLIIVLTSCSNKNNNIQFNSNKNMSEKQENKALSDSEEFNDEFSEEFDDEVKSDPLKYYNILMTNFNDKLFMYALNPIAKGYDYIIHDNIQTAVSNVYSNILFPIRLINNLLQFKFANAAEESGRFIINTTMGLLGIFDIAKSEFDLKQHKEDFGQTLGYWGVPGGFHIVLPILGPSNLRDSLSMFADSYLDPTFSRKKEFLKIPHNIEVSLGISSLETINKTSLNLGQYEIIKKDAIDLYPYLKEIYEQKREFDVKE